LVVLQRSARPQPAQLLMSTVLGVPDVALPTNLACLFLPITLAFDWTPVANAIIFVVLSAKASKHIRLQPANSGENTALSTRFSLKTNRRNSEMPPKPAAKAGKDDKKKDPPPRPTRCGKDFKWQPKPKLVEAVLTNDVDRYVSFPSFLLLVALFGVR
jgi:hypothetical protein